MIFFMFLQMGQLSEFFITVTTSVWFVTCVNSFMDTQSAGCCAFVVTLGAAEIICKGVSLQVICFVSHPHVCSNKTLL